MQHAKSHFLRYQPAGGSSSRPSPCFGEALGPAEVTFALSGPAGTTELRGGTTGANQVAATHAHPSSSPHTHTLLPYALPLAYPQAQTRRAPVGSRAPAAPTRGRQGGNRPDWAPRAVYHARPRTPHQPRQPHQAYDYCPA